jgi:hypothetical protein
MTPKKGRYADKLSHALQPVIERLLQDIAMIIEADFLFVDEM